MSNYVMNFSVKNYQTTIPQLIANNMSGCFFLKHGVYLNIITLRRFVERFSTDRLTRFHSDWFHTLNSKTVTTIT